MEETPLSESQEKNLEPLVEVEATTGLKGWAGEISIKEEKMQGGNISNVSFPYVAFDFDCLLYVPEIYTKKVERYERFPIPWLVSKAVPYYKNVPKAIVRMNELMRYAYNIAVVYVGPKHLWNQKREMLDKFPYTTLICVSDHIQFKEEVAFNEQILSYYSLSAIKVEQAGKKGALFVDWDSLGQKII